MTSKKLSSDFNLYNRCFLLILEDLLEDLIILNKKFQKETGNVMEIKSFCIDIFLKYSNILLLEKNQSLTIKFRLSLVGRDKKDAPYFDKSKIFTNNESQILQIFLDKYSEDTPFAGLNIDHKKRITRNFTNFITSALYFMKKYYNLEDELYSDLETLDPEKFSKQKWLNLKKHRSYVLNNKKSTKIISLFELLKYFLFSFKKVFSEIKHSKFYDEITMFAANLDQIIKEYESLEKNITAFYDGKLSRTFL